MSGQQATVRGTARGQALASIALRLGVNQLIETMCHIHSSPAVAT